MIANIEVINLQWTKAVKVHEENQAEIDCLLKEKSTEVGGL